MAINYGIVKNKFVTESFSQEYFTNEMEYINPPLENIKVASEFSKASAGFSSMAQHIWSNSSQRNNNAAELLEISIKNSTPTQCSSSEFWEANVAVGKHLSWDQWQPLLKTVATALCREGVDVQAEMVFAQVFLNALNCTDEQRAVVFAVVHEPKAIHTKKTQSALMVKMLDKQNVLLKRAHKNSAYDEMKRTFRG